MKFPIPELPKSEVEYRLIEGYEGYAVGSDGSVLSCHRKKWRKMATHTNQDGYLRLKLCNWPKYHEERVHRLVLTAFAGPCPPGMQACHNNGIRTDNRIENLRWDTIKSNSADRILHGTDCRGQKSGSAKLTDNDVIAIRDLVKISKQFGPRQKRKSFTKYTRCQQIADILKVRYQSIHGIVTGRNWTVVEQPNDARALVYKYKDEWWIKLSYGGRVFQRSPKGQWTEKFPRADRKRLMYAKKETN